MINKAKRYLKLTGAVMLSFFITGAISSTVFFRNTPEINPLFITRLKNTPSIIADLPKIVKYSLFGPKDTTPVVANANKEAQSIFSSIPKVTPPAGLTFTPLTKGVSAAEDAQTKTKYITLGDGTKYVVEETVINGKTYKVLHLVTGN